MKTPTAEVWRKYMDAETFDRITEMDSVAQMWAHCVSEYAQETAVTDLKPSGKGEFDGVVLDIISGTYVPKGASLEIMEIKNNKIIVKGV